MSHPGALTNSADVWKTLDAALLSFDAIMTRLAPAEQGSLRSASDDVGYDDPSEGNSDLVHRQEYPGARAAGADERCRRAALACGAGSSGSSSCCDDGTCEDSLHLSFSSQSSGYRSASNASDDALPWCSGSSRHDSADGSVSGCPPLPPLARSPGSSDEAAICFFSSGSSRHEIAGVAPKLRSAGSTNSSPAGGGSSESGTLVGSAGLAGPPPSRGKSSAHHGEKTTSARPSLIPRAATVSAVSEEDFERVFRSTQKAEILSSADLETRLQTIEGVLSDSSETWERRIDALKGLRQLTLAAGSDSAEVAAHLRGLAVGLQLSLAESRSQVTREACLTVGFLAKLLEIGLEPLAEIVFQPLISLVLSSTTVVATAGCIALRFVYRHVHSNRMLVLLIQQTSSKASQIRRQASDLLELVVVGWPRCIIEKHDDRLRDACRKGAEADSDAHVREACVRVLGKLVSWGAGRSDPDEAAPRAWPTAARVRQGLRSDSPCRIAEGWPSGKSTLISLPSSHIRNADDAPKSQVSGQEDRVHHQSLATNGLSDSCSRISPASSSSSQSAHGQQTPGKGLLKAAALAGSRRQATLTGPTMASSTAGLQLQQGDTGDHGVHAAATIAVPLYAPDAWRRCSPLLAGYVGSRQRHDSNQSRDSSEQASASVIAAAVWSESCKDSGAGTADEDDGAGPASDVSSVCSETFEFGHGGASLRKAAFQVHATADIGEVLANVASPLWAARRRGLLQLQRFVAEQRSLSAGELKRVADLFTRIFHDPDLKVYSTFLDTLVDVVCVHPHDLSGWLPTLLSKLLLLNHGRSKRPASITSKMQRALRAVRASFDNALQFHVVCGLLANEGHSMGVQEKLRTLQFLLALVHQMDAADFDGRRDTDVLSPMFEQLVLAAGEVKSAGIRKMAPELLANLFDKNAPEFSYVLSRSTGPVQAAVRTALQAHMQSALAATAGSERQANGSAGTAQAGSSANGSLHTAQQKELGYGPWIGRGSLHGTTASLPPPLLQPQHSGLAAASVELRTTITAVACRPKRTTGLALPDCDRAAACLSNDSGIQSSQDTDLSCPSPLAGDPVASTMENDVSKGQIDAHGEGQLIKATGDAIDGPKKPLSGRLQSLLPDVVHHGPAGDPHEINFHSGARPAQGAGLACRHLSNGSSESHPEEVTVVCDSKVLQMVRGTSELGYRELCTLCNYVNESGLDSLEDAVEPLVWKALRGCQNGSLEATSAAEELLDAIAAAANPEQLLKIVCKVSQSNDSSVRLAAIRTESKIIQQLTKDVAERNVDTMLPGLLQGFNHTESAVRKASVLALVELHAHLGDVLMSDHLVSSLNTGQIKLLNVYIQRTTVNAKQDSNATA